jgi:uncharacterized membrane protein YphA (DoxX/SURF4 family)
MSVSTPTNPFQAPQQAPSPTAQPRSDPKWLYWTGWVITVLPVLGLVMSAVMKFLQPADVLKEFGRLGYTPSHAVPLGIVELTCTILYLIPQTAMLGAILLTGYLGGAIATHVRVSDGFLPPVIMGVLVWLGLYLRDPRLRALVPFRSTRCQGPSCELPKKGDS